MSFKTVALTFGAAIAGGVVVLGGNAFLNSRKEKAVLDNMPLMSEGYSIRRAANETGTPEGPTDFRATAKKVLPSIVSIDAVSLQRGGLFGDEVQEVGDQGSGVIISKDGYIVTNNHVVANARNIKVHLNNGKVYPAEVKGTDPNSDLAVLKVAATDLTPVQVGKSSDVEIGEWVIAVGNPLGFSQTLSVGIVSSLGRSLPTEGADLVGAIQTDAAINPGNSGGALCNAAGYLVGINTAIATPSRGSVGIGFAIPVDRVRRVVDDIIKYGRARYGQLGVNFFRGDGMLQNPNIRAEYQQLTGVEPPQEGIIIRDVVADTPASRAGLKQYTIVLAINDQPLKAKIDLTKALADKKPGDSVTVKYWDKGATKTAKVQLEDLVERQSGRTRGI